MTTFFPDGVQALNFPQYLLGTLAKQLLTNMGANVIKATR